MDLRNFLATIQKFATGFGRIKGYMQKPKLSYNPNANYRAYLGSYWNDYRRKGGIEERAVRYLLADIVLGSEHEVDLEPYKALMREQVEAQEKGLGTYKLTETTEGKLVFRAITGERIAIEIKRNSIAPKDGYDYDGAAMQDAFRYKPFDSYMEWMIKRGTLGDVSHASKVYVALAQDSEVQNNYSLFAIIHNLLFTLQEPLMSRKKEIGESDK